MYKTTVKAASLFKMMGAGIKSLSAMLISPFALLVG